MIILREILLKIGDFIQKIIIKNIALFMTLGLIKWASFYYSDFSVLGDVFTKYVIPLSVGYTAGNMIDKKHGGAAGAAGAGILIYNGTGENLLEIIFISVLLSRTIKLFKEKIIAKTAAGFEMFLTNLFIPVIVLGYYVVLLKTVPYINNFFAAGSNFILSMGKGISGIIILTVLIEVCKIFFINNFINHGILALAGYEEIMNKGDSLFFLLETNPGTGLGILAACYFFTKNRESLKLNMAVEFLGGIHEVYFYYVLKNLKLLMALICGGIAGNIFFYVFNVTLSSVPSPGSIIIIGLLSASSRFLLFTGIFLSAVVSFGVGYMILYFDSKKKEIKEEASLVKVLDSKYRILILCRGGMGTSRIGKTLLQNVLREKNIKNIEVYSSFIGDETEEADIIITHNNFKKDVEKLYPEKIIVSLEDYMDKKFYYEFAEKYLIKETFETESREILKENEEKIKIELGLKSIGEDESIEHIKRELGTEEGEIIFLENKILLFSCINFSSSRAVICQYPYGIKNSRRGVFLAVGICAENIEEQNLVLENLKKISCNEKVMSDLEISDEIDDFKNIFSMKNLFAKGEKADAE